MPSMSATCAHRSTSATPPGASTSSPAGDDYCARCAEEIDGQPYPFANILSEMPKWAHWLFWTAAHATHAANAAAGRLVPPFPRRH